jgi:hypothetical protein
MTVVRSSTHSLLPLFMKFQCIWGSMPSWGVWFRGQVDPCFFLGFWSERVSTMDISWVSRVQIRVFLREGFSWSCCFGVGGL